MKRSYMVPPQKIVGLIPAAGYSRRLAPIPCSKEIYPVGFEQTPDGFRPKPVCSYLIESMKAAGVTSIYVVVRKGKLDIPMYLGDGRHLGVDVAYRVMDDSPGPLFSLDHAYPFVKDAIVAFGFPDIIFDTPQSFNDMLSTYREKDADVVLGVFRIRKAVKDDRVVLDHDGRVTKFAVSTSGDRDPDTWLMAIWGPRFTEFLHEFLRKYVSTGSHDTSELTVGHVLEPAFRAGLRFHGIQFRKGRYLDIGVPNNLRMVVQRRSRRNGF